MNNYDGKIVIKTTLDNSDFDKEISNLTKRYNNLQKKIEDVWAKKKTTEHEISGQRTTEALTPEELDYVEKLHEQQRKITERKRELLGIDEEIVQKEREITQTNTETAKSSEEVTEQSRTQTAQILKMSFELEQMVDDYNKMQKADIVSEDDIKDAEVLKADILELVKEIEKLSGKKISIKGITDTKNELPKIGEGIENIVKKVGKWALAVFGVRSAYMFIRQSMSTLSQYNEKLSSDIQYIRWALATALKPIIEAIVNLVYRLISYVIYIGKEWGLISKSADFSAKAFQKANKGVKDTNKSAKQLQKTLAGFDEMNILQQNGSVSSGGGGGGIASPTMDLDKIEIPGWVDWIAKNKDTLIRALKEIGAVLLIAFAVKNILEFSKGIESISKLLGGMSSLKIFEIIGGIAMTIWGIVEVIEALTADNFHLEDALKGVSDAVIGIGLITAAFTPWGWVTVGIGLLGELVSSIIDTRTDAEKLEEANKNLADAQRQVNDAYQDYVNASKTHLQAYKNYEKAQQNLTKTAKDLKLSEDKLNEIGKDLFEGIRNGTVDIKTLKRGEEDLTKTYGLSKEQLMKVYEAYVDVLDTTAKLTKESDKLTETEKTLTDAEKNQIVQQLDKQKILSDSVGSYQDYRDAVIDAYEQEAISAEEASSRLAEAFNKTKKESRQAFVDDIPGYMQDLMKESNLIFDNVGVEWRNAIDDMKIYTNSLAGVFNSKFGKDIPNSVKKTIDKMTSLTKLLEKLPFGKTWSLYINSKLSGSGNAKGAIYYPPKLAVGGIINQPGRGVPLAIGGERGAEGVIPLTDSQAMNTLGQVIARNISVNLNNTIEMNGRVISRELKQIQNEEDFAFNGG